MIIEEQTSQLMNTGRGRTPVGPVLHLPPFADPGLVRRDGAWDMLLGILGKISSVEIYTPTQEKPVATASETTGAAQTGRFERLCGLPRNVWAVGLTSFFKLFSGWLSDKARERKWLAVLGYAISAASKPFFYFATTWTWIAGARWSPISSLPKCAAWPAAPTARR